MGNTKKIIISESQLKMLQSNGAKLTESIPLKHVGSRPEGNELPPHVKSNNIPLKHVGSRPEGNELPSHVKPDRPKLKVKESPNFGGEEVSQEMYDELQYDKSTMEKSMGDAFQTPDGYEMKNHIEIGSYNTPDGDEVEVVGQTPDGHIKVILTHSDETIQQYKKWGVPPPQPLKITWSKVQFDAIMGKMDDHNESQYQGERHGY